MQASQPSFIGDEIGVVLSGASASLAPIMLRRDRELSVREEDIAVIVDQRLDHHYLLGVVRWVTRYEPFLKRSIHNIYAERPEALDHELVMPFSNAVVEIYASICDGGATCGGRYGIDVNNLAPTPGARVYRVREPDQLTSYLGLSVDDAFSIGVHKYSGWRLPLNARWTGYHVGVFGATGTGKSRLVLRLISELMAKGFSLIVFDHSGVDYAPYAERLGGVTVASKTIRINPVIYASTMSRYLGLSGYQRDLVEITAACFAMKVYREQGAQNYSSRECEELVKPARYARARSLSHYALGDRGGDSLRERFLEDLQAVAQQLNMRDATIAKIRLVAKLSTPPHLFEDLRERRREPRELVELALQKRLVIIDMSDEQDIEVKRAILASIAEAGWDMIRSQRTRINLGLVVDEAQNYACEYCGEAGRALETIAREGRKWNYFIIVASQRVAKDIRTGVRSNLGTVFFSRLQSTGDLQELSGYLDLGRVSETSLAMLGQREFYAAGLMNPLRRPLLLRIDETG
ncbi:MAG: hypothetical protein DSY37_03825 [Hyperthermus sp.]|nr:MAG: hypothetical protein DSY37_03825 [Hyperthermus sp.]